MELTPEEKNRIYAEEKARREALAKIKEEEKQKEKQNNEEARKKGSQICLKIIAFITITWLLYYPTKALLSAIFLSDTDLARVSEIEQLNANIDRDKSALWDVGMKDAGRSIHL
ncbi:MAG: hypothetical protein M1508_01210 [Nitrospirae bacterium]|nr:hypothetical protein [Nitrospirota bacterium]